MAKLDDIFKSEYLKASDIPEEGLILTIAGCELVELGQGKDKETKPVLSFKEVDKGLVCNKTNCGTIHKLTGSDDTDDWEGHKIRLITLEVDFQGTLTNAIRVSSKPVKAAAPKKPSTAPTEEEDSEIPF